VKLASWLSSKKKKYKPKGDEVVSGSVIEKDGVLFVKSEEVVKMFKLDSKSENHKDLIIFKHELVDALALLETASILSLKEPLLLSRNLDLVEFAGVLCKRRSELPFMFHSVSSTIMKHFLDSLPDERAVHKWFKKNFKKHLGDEYKIIKVKNNPKHIPDFWLEKEKVHIPVEIKLGDFNLRHLDQLQRYMNVYGCQNGIAVGQTLKCVLPSNVEFVAYNPKEIVAE